MDDEVIRVLLVEDNRGDALLVGESLAEAGPGRFALEYADRMSSALTRLDEGGVDLVLLDLSLPDSQGLDSFLTLHARAGPVPVIVLTGMADEGLALEAVERGAQDYLVKGRIQADMLARSVRYAIGRGRAERALRASELAMRTFQDSSPMMMGVVELVGDDVLFVSPNAITARYLGLPLEALRGRLASGLGLPRERTARWLGLYRESRRDGRPARREFPEDTSLGPRWISTTVCSLADTPDGRARFSYVAEDVTERKEAEEALRVSEERFARAVRGTSDGIWDWLCSTDEVYYSPRFKALLGYEDHEFPDVLDSWSNRLHPQDKARISDALTAHCERRVLFDVEYRLLTRSGEYRWFHDRGQAEWDEAMRPTRMAGSISDVTTRYLAEEELLASERRFRAVFDQTFLLAGLLSPEGILLEVNGMALEFGGVTREEVLGRPFWETSWWDTTPKNRERLRAAIVEAAQGRPVGFEVEVRDAAGVHVSCDFSLRPVRDESGAVVLLVPEGRDITERKRAEKEQARLVAILDATTDFVGIADPSGRALYVNRGGRQLVGRTGEDISQTLISDYQPAWANEILRTVAIPTALEEGTWSGELAISGGDGGEIPVSQVILVHKDSEGDVEFISTIARDITDRKRANESNARLAAIVESSDDAIIGKDLSGIVTFWNDGANRLFGYTAEEMVGTPIDRLIPPDRKTEEHDILGQLKRGERIKHFESVRVAKDGRMVEVSLTISPIRDPAGKVIGASKIVRDITERRRSEKEILLLNSQLERRLSRLNALRQIDTAITASFDLGVTLSTLLDQVTSQLGVDAADVLMLDPDARTLRYSIGRGFSTDSMQQVPLDVERSVPGRVVSGCAAFHLPDITLQDPPFVRAEAMAKEGFVAYSAVPLVSQGMVKGVLEVFHRSRLEADHEWLDFLGTLAGSAAIAIDSARMFEDLRNSNAELTVAYDATIEGWSRALDLRDEETEGHTRRVTEMSLGLARAMGIDESELVNVRRGALLHDVGKLGVPDAILLKPGKLTEEEWVVMRRHPTHAYEWLAPIAFLRPALEIPYCHHEKWDGTGYPRGLKGEQIPLAARMFAAVDICDALLSDRPYRKGWPVEKVREHILSLSGSHLDPRVVEAFVPMIDEPGLPVPKESSRHAGVREAGAGEADSELLGAAFRAMLEHSDDFVVLLDGSWQVQAASRSFLAAFAPGHSPRGLDFIGLLDSGSRDKFRTLLSRPLDGPLTLELNHLTPSRSIRLVNYSVCELSRPPGTRLLTAVGRGQEASLELVEKLVLLNQELEESRRTLAEQALSDPLTGLGNRRWLFERLEALWAEGRRRGRLPWVMMADLDHFKAVNDTYGHQAGDEVLIAASRAMRATVRTEDLVARYGGEEFVIAGLCDPESEPSELAVRVLEAIRALRVECPGGPLRVTSSIGIALAEPDPSNPPWVVLQSADRALYRAKAGGRDRCEAEPGVLGRRTASLGGVEVMGKIGFCSGARAS